jgi:protein-tyrosine phosphatase
VIDLHAHVLPGIDDGPVSMEEAVETAAVAAREGVRTLAATPHVRPDHPRVRPAELADRTAALRAACAQAGVEIELVSGGEIDLAWAQRADDATLAAASYGGRGHDLLVETPYSELVASFEELVLRLSGRGFRVLLAHPERNPTLQRNPERLRALVDGGTLLQVTAGALTRTDRRSRSRRLAVALLHEGAAHVLASDRHGAAIARIGLREGVEAASREAGARATWMATDAPAAVLAGDPLPPPPAATPRRSRRRWPRRG